MATLWRLIKTLFDQPSIKFTFKYTIEGWFIWLPLFLAYIFWQTWLYYIRLYFIKHLSWTLLEIKIPREITKSPRAMEVVFSALHATRDGNLVERFWYGFLRIWYSFEIISVEGQIHFLIRAQGFVRNFVEAQIYAQYPGAEILEVEDYVNILSAEDLEKDWDAAGVEYFLAKEDAYPIRTYVDFGLEAGRIKEEEKTDPLTSFLEAMGSLHEGEQVWCQMLIRPAGKEWKDKAQNVVEELKNKTKDATGEAGEASWPILSPGERDVMEGVESNTAKLGYETGIRIIYIAKKDAFTSIRKSILYNAMKQYSTQNMNSFKLTSTSVDYFFVKRREMWKKKTILQAYQQRSWFYMPYRRSKYVLNTEALATLYHFPGRVAETPTLGRIETKRAEPPINLPI